MTPGRDGPGATGRSTSMDRLRGVRVPIDSEAGTLASAATLGQSRPMGLHMSPEAR
jgi:hypothetical protein